MPDTKHAALVTGAREGLGAAIAVELARDGFDVAVTELSAAPLAQTVAAIEGVGRRALAIEWAEHGIRVNAIAPGATATPSRAAHLAEHPGLRETVISRIPQRRLGKPQEMARAVCYLVGPEGSYIAGQTLVLDGGLTAY